MREKNQIRLTFSAITEVIGKTKIFLVRKFNFNKN